MIELFGLLLQLVQTIVGLVALCKWKRSQKSKKK